MKCLSGWNRRFTNEELTKENGRDYGHIQWRAAFPNGETGIY